MSSYFDRVEQGMAEVVERRAHRSWYGRLLGVGRTRPLVVVLAALVVAAPAVGAVTNWFGLGAPDRFPSQSPTLDAGRALPGRSELLGLRVPDPQGGPPWGLRLAHTTRGDTCLQLGRVEDGRLGSLGIDDAWNNDHLFHPFPNASEGDDCGTTDAAGHGFVNVAYTGTAASANPTVGAAGPQAKSCVSIQTPLRPLPPLARRLQRRIRTPTCPPGSTRIVFMGLLGPDATSITYEAPDSTLKTAKTSGRDGAYLLVFPLNATTCALYTHGPFGGYGPCGDTEAQGGASPGTIGAVKAITYRDGHTCRVAPPEAIVAAQRAVMRQIVKLPAGARSTEGRKLFDALLAKEHLKPGWEARYESGRACPPVGYVGTKQPRVTTAMVATPISVKVLPREYGEIAVEFTFIARGPVRGSSSWYEDSFTNPANCPSSGQGGQIGFGNVIAGQLIHDKRLLGTCKGVYHGVIGYMPNSGPINQNSSGGGTPGKDGAVVVGRFSFTIR